MSVMESSSGPIDDGQKRKKRTRTRKSRTRTSDVEEVQKESASPELDEDKEETTAKKSVERAGDEVGERAVVEKESGDKDQESKGKRKRKRIRSKGKREEGDAKVDEEIVDQPSSSGKAVPAAAPGISKSMQTYLDSLGDPQKKSETLSEKTINALSYARQYHVDRSGWKFNKAKQEYLIRHMLTAPSDSPGQDVEQGEDGETSAEGQQYWPDEWNRCVARYLATIQGKARHRLYGILTKASEQVIPEAHSQENTTVDGATQSKSNDIPEKKTVSFGDLAMAQDAAAVDAQDKSIATVSVAEVQKRQFQKDRASKLLLELNE